MLILGFHHIKIAGGSAPGETYLSCQADGFVDLYDKDDESGRQRWEFIEVPGKSNTYNIRVWSGTHPGESYLSCTAEGMVDLYDKDDGSGRQQWVLNHLGNSKYNIKIAGGTNTGETYLSTTDHGRVDLFSHDDNSGRQKWIIDPPVKNNFITPSVSAQNDNPTSNNSERGDALDTILKSQLEIINPVRKDIASEKRINKLIMDKLLSKWRKIMNSLKIIVGDFPVLRGFV